MPSSSHASDLDSDSPRFSDASTTATDWPAEPRLRGLRWRVLLGVLPPCPAPIESLRREAANGRRRYADYRRRLIVDPHAVEDAQRGENLNVDNPLSQDPDSIWGRYFKNAELERIIENDLNRLYPEHEIFFQSFPCQAMLRRVLLVWALIHPQYGYKQGMHELLAPLVYVLHMDVTHLSHVRQRYEDPFEDRFDTPFEENYSSAKDCRQAASSFSSRSTVAVPNEGMLTDDDDWINRVHPEDAALIEPDDFGFNIKTMVLGSDSYGAEGELGALLSARFVEHDAYCMLDALLRGKGGGVVLAEYFTALNEGGSGMSPVLEASAAMYHTLAAVDLPLYIHLVGLGVEPQFFALRWLRVLFGREFDLDKLLLLWDAIFTASNSNINSAENKHTQSLSTATRGGLFISNFAVSMMLYLRPTLLAASNATSCLQKLLNFPKNVDIRNLIENAKMLRSLTEDTLKTPSPGRNYSVLFGHSRSSKSKHRSHSPSFQHHVPASSKILQHRHTGSPEMIRSPLPDSYWEERWMNSVLTKVEETDNNSDVDSGAITTPGTSEEANISEESVKQAESTAIQQENNTTSRNIRRNLLSDILEEAECSGSKTSSPVSSSTDLPGAVGDSDASQDRDVTNEAKVENENSPGPSIEVPTFVLSEIEQKHSASEECLQNGTGDHGKSGNMNFLCKGDETDDDSTANDGNTSSVDHKIRQTRDFLQGLGLSMGESIQVLETALCSLGKEGSPTTENMSKALVNGKGQTTALSALAELRRIGNILLQMS